MNWYKDQIESSRKIVEAFKAITTDENMKAVREATDYLNADHCEKCSERITKDYSGCNCK